MRRGSRKIEEGETRMDEQRRDQQAVRSSGWPSYRVVPSLKRRMSRPCAWASERQHQLSQGGYCIHARTTSTALHVPI
jgi:hypothetical protein